MKIDITSKTLAHTFAQAKNNIYLCQVMSSKGRQMYA